MFANNYKKYLLLLLLILDQNSEIQRRAENANRSNENNNNNIRQSLADLVLSQQSNAHRDVEASQSAEKNKKELEKKQKKR